MNDLEEARSDAAETTTRGDDTFDPMTGKHVPVGLIASVFNHIADWGFYRTLALLASGGSLSFGYALLMRGAEPWMLKASVVFAGFGVLFAASIWVFDRLKQRRKEHAWPDKNGNYRKAD